MIKLSKKEQCNGCHACAEICPKKCIEMVPDKEGFLYPHIDKKACVHCGLCETTCPIISKKTTSNPMPKAYAAYNKNEEVRSDSSSGGVFHALAMDVIAQGGVVFGAAVGDDAKVSHQFIETPEELRKLQGSKYVQSRIGNAYSKAKEFLDEGRMVYFSGTPCQIGGLLSFLKKPYDNLITQDLICHGVPSPLLWEKYVSFREEQAQAKVEDVSFRAKNEGWRCFSMRLRFADGSRYCENKRNDVYLRAFISNLSLRPSCYACSFKSITRQADMTLADFWGVQKVLPQMYDDKGTSLLLLHSEKAVAIFNRIQPSLSFQEVDLNESLKGNISIERSANKPYIRNRFIKRILKSDYTKAESFMNVSLFDRCVDVIRKCLLLLKG